MINLTNAPRLGRLFSRAEKGSVGIHNLSMNSRRIDSRAHKRGFSMVGCVGAPSGAPFSLGFSGIVNPASSDRQRFTTQRSVNLNSRRPLVSANTRTVSTDTIDKLYGRAQNIQGAAHALFLVSEEIEELNTDNASSVAFHILRNFIQQQAEKIMEEA